MSTRWSRWKFECASHPFYTGKHKTMDTGGRVDRFKRRYQK